jgi:2-iminobutanoate/2-iminopropanoate deaminase
MDEPYPGVFDVQSIRVRKEEELKKQVIKSEKAPPALGPYSVGIKTGNFVFTSGQIGLDPASGNLVPGGIKAETKQVLTNIANVLSAAGCSMENVIKTTVFLTDMTLFQEMNSVYATFFHEPFPARSTVQVGALPKSAAVEIEATAILK